MNNSAQINDEILLELWQAAVFDDSCYEALEKFVSEAKKKLANNKSLDDLYISEEILNALATTRNRNLIYKEEQQKLQKTVVGFFGLSVGSHSAVSWMMESRAACIKIMDNDTISPSNLNRLRGGWESVGKAKSDFLAQELSAINPSAKIIATTDINPQATEKMFVSPPLDIVVDAIDDMKGKILLRKLAKERKIPLLSAADVGDNVVLDIERYDLNPQPLPFLGRIANIETIDFDSLSDLERKKMIINLVGFEKNSEQLLDSLLALGKTLGTWPQLGATATIAGGVIATTIKKIILGEKVKSGRYYLSLDDILVSDFNNSIRMQTREEKVDQIKRKFNLK